jgi:salicylate hydroxylase
MLSYIVSALRKAENIKLWELRDHDPLPTYTTGRLVLIGDAAHAMTPHQGQGASQAIEDGEGLSLFIDQAVSRETVPDVLRDFDRTRRVRASKIQLITRSLHSKMSAEAVWENQRYNFTYHGIRDLLAKQDAGQEI